jgi:TetR/AcrR family transcriptional regulator, regulator of cefoperazone and chloramphenicol sensitivity
MMALLSAGGAVPPVAEVAAAADVYPNQVTHHFGSKDRLYVEAAFALLLRETERLQAAGRRMRTPESFRSALARTALAMPSLRSVVVALALAQQNDEVRDEVRRSIEILFRQSERYLDRRLARQGWVSDHGTARDVTTFWSAAFGAVLLSTSGIPGGPSEVDLAAALTIRTADPNS